MEPLIGKDFGPQIIAGPRSHDLFQFASKCFELSAPLRCLPYVLREKAHGGWGARLQGSKFLRRPLRSLYDVCHEAGRDRQGEACPICPVRDLCEDQIRRKGQRSENEAPVAVAGDRAEALS